MLFSIVRWEELHCCSNDPCIMWLVTNMLIGCTFSNINDWLILICVSCVIGPQALWTQKTLLRDQPAVLWITHLFPNKENLTASILSTSWHIRRWMVMTSLYVTVKYAAAWSALSFWQVIRSASSGSSFTPGKAGAGPRPHNGVQGELK